MKVRDLLGEKVRPVHTIAGHRSVDNAIDIMTGKQATALIVMQNEEPIGIFTERDVFRCHQRNIKDLSEIDLHEAMTDKLLSVSPEDDAGRLITIMIKADIRHAPVIEKNKLIGLLTLNDLTEQQIESLNDEIHQLQDYIDDLHEAARD